MRILLLGLLSVGVLVGCSTEPQPPTEYVGAEPPPKAAPAPPALPAPLDYPRGGRVELNDSSGGLEQATQLTERVKAKVGVGSKGRSLENERHSKLLTTPAVSYFKTRERVIFEIQIPKALQLYEALNGKPKTEQEYFSQVIEANGIKLPELPAGQRYVYDPQKGELFVERPAR